MARRSLSPGRHAGVGIVAVCGLVALSGCPSKPQESDPGEQDGAVAPRDEADADAGSDDEANESEAGAPATIDWDSCDETHAAGVRALLERQCEVADAMVPPGLPTIDRSPAAAPDDAFAVELAAGSVMRVQGRELSPYQIAEGLGRQLAMEYRRAEMMGKAGPDRFALTIAAEVPRGRVSSALEQLHAAKLSQGVLVLAANEKAELPEAPDPALVEEIVTEAKDLPPDQKAVKLATRMNALVGGCPAAQKAFSAIAGAAPEQRCKLLAAGVSESMVTCGCPAQEKKILSVLHAINVGDGDGSLGVAVPVTIDPGAKLAEGASWSEVVSALEIGEGSLTLGVQD